MISKNILKKIDETKPKEKQFGEYFGFYQLFWIFMIGCFLGVIVEILFCMVKNGYYQSRVGLVYGPFNLVYGFGALALTLGLHWIKEKNVLFIFLGGMMIGSFVEYSCSWVQETILGTVSWDYSDIALNLHGRISLQYSAYWGILAIMWIKIIYPFMVEMINKIPRTYGYLLTWIVLIFMLYNTCVSAFAVYRWQERMNFEAPSSRVDQYFDFRFPNEKMEHLFPNMRQQN